MTHRKKDNSIPWKTYDTNSHIPWYNRILPTKYGIMLCIIAGILAFIFAKTIVNIRINKELLLQQREQIYSEIYE